MQLINVWGPAAAHSLSVVTKDWKYIYWPYAATGFQATEELYNTTEDPLELRNRIEDPASQTALKEMQARHATAVAHWKRSSVPYHNYEKFGTIFDRDIPWKEKAPLVDK